MAKVLKFSENAKVHYLLNEFVLDVIYNDITKDLWDVKYLNSIDRDDLGEQYVNIFVREYEEELIDSKTGKIDEDLKMALTDYAKREIDRLIPKIYFVEKNKELCEMYTKILVRRVYDVANNSEFKYMKDFKYQYDHSKILKEIKENIKETQATEKQIQCLESLGKNIGYLLWHEEYLSKNYANQLIKYLMETDYVEPAIFSFFFVAKWCKITNENTANLSVCGVS